MIAGTRIAFAIGFVVLLATGCKKSPQPLGAECSSNSGCESEQCLKMPKGEQRCTAECKADSDCASASMICHGMGSCVLPGAGKPVGTECTLDKECEHGMCLTVMGGTNYCTKRCTEDKDCTTGFTCQSDFIKSPNRERPKFCARKQ